LNTINLYLKTFPLFSSKFLDYKDWKIAAELFIKDLHSITESKADIDKLKFNMNTNRSFFNWNHLNKF
jgi:hypothetical protein